MHPMQADSEGPMDQASFTIAVHVCAHVYTCAEHRQHANDKKKDTQHTS